MAEKKYDIFISYRSEDGAQYARILQLQLEKLGYKVFLDYEELKRDRFGDDIIRAIQTAPIFLMILTPNYLERSKEQGNWIKKEIEIAIEEKKHFVPINPDRKFNGIPEGVSLQIADIVENYQHSNVDFGQTLKVTFELMVKNQIMPIVKPRKKLGGTWIVAIIIVFLALVSYALLSMKNDANLRIMRTDLEKKYSNFFLYLSPDVSAFQMKTIDDILEKMVEIKNDSLWISKFEFSVDQWNGIIGEKKENTKKGVPVTEKSFGEIFMFLGILSDLTNLNFDLPSVQEWEFAAHGGVYNETTLYSGDEEVDQVAWYKNNSGGQIHPSDGQQGLAPNNLDIYDMSGNVGEICNTRFEGGLYTVCGGNYNSPASNVTVYSRIGIDTDAKDKTVGFRVVVRR